MRGIPAPETAANAIGRHKVMIAVEPATMVPTKKIKPKTKKLGMGSASNNPGKAVITLVCVKRSLKIITTKVLMTIRASNADRKNSLISCQVNRLVKKYTMITPTVAIYTGTFNTTIKRMITAIVHKLRQRLCKSANLSVEAASPVSFGTFRK